jgi:uncharacterized protein (TIGR02266 family)
MKPVLGGKPGFSTTVITPWGKETYQVWVEQAPPVWVARILTLPNRIWAAPGAREAMKFHGASFDEAESAAAQFIEEERIANSRRVWVPPVDRPDQRRPAAAAGAGAISGPPPGALRVPHRLLLRFGVQAPQLPGLTANLSETGLFIITDRPGPIGAQVRIDLRFPERPLLLGGEVVWVRERREQGNLGFGVRLIEAPDEYTRRLMRL